MSKKLSNQSTRGQAAAIVERWLDTGDFPNRMLEDVREDLADIRQADKAMAAYERDPSGAITLGEYERRRGSKVRNTRSGLIEALRSSSMVCMATPMPVLFLHYAPMAENPRPHGVAPAGTPSQK